MIAAAWEEATVSDIFQQWFDASHSQDLSNVLERFVFKVDHVPSPLMRTWACEKPNLGCLRRISYLPVWTGFTSGQHHEMHGSGPVCLEKIKSPDFTLLHEAYLKSPLKLSYQISADHVSTSPLAKSY